MEASIAHVAVRTHPDLAVHVIARVNGREFQVRLASDVVERLCGPGARDEQSIVLALTRHLRELRVAIAAYVIARGVPMDNRFVLAWSDIVASDEAAGETGPQPSAARA